MNIPFSLPIAKTFTAALLALSLTATINTTHAAEIEMSFQTYSNKNAHGLVYKPKPKSR